MNDFPDFETACNQFIEAYNNLAYHIHQTAVEKGWWERQRNQGEIIALIHSELSEALEGIRNNNPPDKHCPFFGNIEVEFGDVIVRVMDCGEGFGYNIAEAMVEKVKFNRTRGYKHGGKAF